jgi:diguanylate cyclase (GGDEF)-like protein/PAS domain S-box-containing protein
MRPDESQLAWGSGLKRILLVNPSASHRDGVVKLLRSKGYAVDLASSFEEGAARLREAESPGSDLVGLLLGWPNASDTGFQAFLNSVNHRHDHLAVLLMCAEMSSNAVGWLKFRKRTALLLWSDFGEAPEALSKLLDPSRQRRPSYLEEMEDHHLRVLFVDDSPTVRIAFRRLLMKHGFLVDTAAGAVEGYRKALSQQFDLAIIDYFMPEQNGVALVQKLRSDKRTKHLVAAVITGTYSDTVIKDSLAAGAVECIFKNEARELFLARIASLARGIVDRKSIDNERRRLEGILCSVGDGVFGVNAQGVIQFVNPAALDILGYSSDDEMIGGKAYDLFHDRFEDGNPMPAESCFLSQCYESGNQVSGWRTTFWDRGGRAIPVECTIYPLEIDGHRKGSVVAFRDVSARKQLEEELRWQATHDSLTKLHNRSYFESEIEQEVHRLRRSDQASALLFVDLDRFKYINDTAGHAAGDRLLIEVAQRLNGRLRASDSLARIGGDEYAIILRNVRADSLDSAADQFRLSLEEEAFNHGGKQYLVSATIGVALIDRSSSSPGEVMANADIACHLAKNKGRNRIHIYSSESDEKASMDMELGWSHRLKEALTRNLFTLRFQPILPLNEIDFDAMPLEEGSLWRQNHPSLKGEVADYEVLLRLQDSEGKLIAPDAFLPTAERFNMMSEIDRWVVSRSLDTLAKLQGNGRRARFSINLSEQSLLDYELVPFVKQKLLEHGLAGKHVTFELAEARAVAHIDSAQRLVEELKQLGCRVGLDDFGTGFTSFSNLKQLDVDYLKIDGTYLRSMGSDPINAAVLSAIARIAHALGKTTIAECVEDARTVQALRNSGVDELQGFFIARPQEELAFEKDGAAGNVTPITRGRAS